MSTLAQHMGYGTERKILIEVIFYDLNKKIWSLKVGLHVKL